MKKCFASKELMTNDFRQGNNPFARNRSRILLSRCVRLSAILMATSLTVGCAINATMVPMSGPLSEMRPVPVVNVRAETGGKLTFVLPPDDHCEGRWGSAGGGELSIASGSLMSQYGSTYLNGYSISTGHGQNPGRALAMCKSGRVLDLEFMSGTTAHGFGIGKDNENNVYRFVF